MELNVRTCSLCGKMYKYKGNAMCPSCLRHVDDDYLTVRDYLYSNPSAGIQELSEKTEVDEKIILHLVRMGRLTFAEGVDTGIRCSDCGKPIAQGTLCESCTVKLSQELFNALPEQMRKKEAPAPAQEGRRGGARLDAIDRRNPRQ